MKALTTTLVIDTHEERDVAICDAPGAYFNALIPNDKYILLKYVNEFVDLMCMTSPSLNPIVRMEGKKVLYLKVL